MTRPHKNILSEEQVKIKLQGFANEIKKITDEYDVGCMFVFSLPCIIPTDITKHAHQIDQACRITCRGEALGMVAQMSKMIAYILDQLDQHADGNNLDKS